LQYFEGITIVLKRLEREVQLLYHEDGVSIYMYINLGEALSINMQSL